MIVSFVSSSCRLGGFSSFLELIAQRSQVAELYSTCSHSLGNFEEQPGLVAVEEVLLNWKPKAL